MKNTQIINPSKYRPLIEAALRHSGGTHSYEDVAGGIGSGRYQLWPGLLSVVVTEVVQFPQKKIVHCFIAAGSLPEIHNIRTWAETWARGIGCSAVTVNGRGGWERELARDGYKKTSVLLEKVLEVAGGQIDDNDK